jgi:hypothetical protein
VNALRIIINPMMLWTLSRGQHEILTKDVIDQLMSEVFRSPDEQGRYFA